MTGISSRTRQHAKALRREMTIVERRLWLRLREFRTIGIAVFRRQAAIGPYIVDFAWLSGRLVVELDGGQHAEVRRRHDMRRDAWLRGQGFEVLRFWNNEVVENIDGVMEAIWLRVQARPVPPPGLAASRLDRPPHEGEGRVPSTDVGPHATPLGMQSVVVIRGPHEGTNTLPFVGRVGPRSGPGRGS